MSSAHAAARIDRRVCAGTRQVQSCVRDDSGKRACQPGAAAAEQPELERPSRTNPQIPKGRVSFENDLKASIRSTQTTCRRILRSSRRQNLRCPLELMSVAVFWPNGVSLTSSLYRRSLRRKSNSLSSNGRNQSEPLPPIIVSCSSSSWTVEPRIRKYGSFKPPGAVPLR